VCPAVTLSHQYGRHSAVALLLKAALIQVSDYRLQEEPLVFQTCIKDEGKTNLTLAMWVPSYDGLDVVILSADTVI
jgi:hypothetical protein